MIDATNVYNVLEQTLGPVSLGDDNTKVSLQSSVLLSALNGSILSYATNLSSSNDDDINSINNLKMMTLLCKDKWTENENDSPEPHYTFKMVNNNENLVTNLYNYEIENLHTCIAQIPNSDLLLLFIANSNFPYGLLSLKMKFTLNSCKNLISYKLGA